MLESIITSRARIKVLQLFLLGRQERYYLRELSTLTHLPIRSVQREVANLSESGIILKETSGRQTYYRTNERCPIIPELKMMLIKTVGLGDVLREALIPANDSIDVAFIFGSFATGELTPESDIDIFIIGNITLRQVVTLMNPVQISREINPIVVPRAEFRDRVAEGDHFFTSVIDTPKIFLIGDENELAKLAGFGRPDQATDI